MAGQPVYDPLGMYCAAGRRVLGVTTPNDLNWTEPCPEIPTGRHVIDFRGAGQAGLIGQVSFCRAHGQVILGDIQRWFAIWGDPAQPPDEEFRESLERFVDDNDEALRRLGPG